MKPDKFDEAIRQKLEGLQPHFQEEDWAKFKAYQKAAVPATFWQQYHKKLLYTAASVAAAMMVFANVYQYRQNHQLRQTLTKLQANSNADAPVRVSTRVDTIYITKYVPVTTSSSHNSYDPSLPLTPSHQKESIALQPQASWEVLEKNKKVQQRPVVEQELPEASTGVGISKRTSKNEQIGVAAELTLTDESLAIKNTKRPSEAQGRTYPQRSPFIGEVAKNEGVSQKSAAVKEDLEEESKIASDHTVDFLLPLQSTEQLPGIEPAEIKVKKYAFARLKNEGEGLSKESKASSPPPSISLRNVRFRAGIGGTVGDKLLGYSLNTSLLLGKYWSLDVGIGQTNINGPQFFTEDAFKERMNRDFHTWNRTPGPRPPQAPPLIYNIKTNVTLWRMPINLTYRWPMRDGYALLFSGGTHLNMSAVQGYRYHIKERNEPFREESGQFDVKPTLTNDVILAAGLEKQWRGIVFQAKTYMAPYLKKPAYLSENRNLGVRLTLLYQFGKKTI
ncbi:MAG: hypothetical protein ACK4GN_03695 [Runella sp.]